MILSILIPTFNRAEFLISNLELLSVHLKNLNRISDVEVIVSNNSSPDNTDEEIRKFIKINPNLDLKYFNQDINVGLENNALFVLGKAIGDYVMFLGDDDYVSENYLKEILYEIGSYKSLTVIIPSFIAIEPNGTIIQNSGRDLGYERSFYKKGVKNCYINSWRGHQMSGLVLKREGIYDGYFSNKVNNIYPFIYFVAFNSLRGSTIHLPEYPVKVTQVNQAKKDWNYGGDGLLNEVYDNYDKINLNIFYKTILQLKFYSEQPWRLFMYNKSNRLLKAFLAIWFSKNSTIIYKLVFPIIVFIVYVKNKFKREDI